MKAYLPRNHGEMATKKANKMNAVSDTERMMTSAITGPESFEDEDRDDGQGTGSACKSEVISLTHASPGLRWYRGVLKVAWPGYRRKKRIAGATWHVPAGNV